MPGGAVRARAFSLISRWGVQVDRGGVDAFVSEPERDDGGVYSGFEQAHGGGVPQDVGGDVFGVQRWAGGCGGALVAGESALDGVAAQWLPGSCREDRIRWFGW